MSTEHDPDDPAKSTSKVNSTAESTRFRSAPGMPPSAAPGSDVSRRTSDAYYGSNKSIRMSHFRPFRGSLAIRLAVPILLTMMVAFFAVSLIVRDQVIKIQMADLKMDAVNSVYTTSVFGRLVLSQREQFLLRHPDYLRNAEWKTGEHWLITQGVVPEKEWVAATGFQLDEFAPASVMDQAAQKTVLHEFEKLLDSDETRGEIVAAYLLNADGSRMAASVRNSYPLDYFALKATPFSGETVRIGNTLINLDYITDVPPEPVMRAVARLYAHDDEDTLLGMVALVMRTARHLRQQKAFFFLLLSLAALLTLLMAGVCWYSARRVVLPLRRLAGDMQAIAEGDFSRRAAVRESDETGQLAQSFNTMVERLRLARLNEQETSRLESDLAIARDIQNNLLPLQTPRVRGLDIHTAYRPAKEIGGDYFDFLPIDEKHIGLTVADASGKSIPAALVMSTTRAILRFVAPGSRSPAETLTRVNAILSVDIPKGMFVTAYYVILDPLNNTMVCASAGHTPLLIARSDGSVELLNPGGIALGFDSGAIFQRSIREQRIKLEKGDRVLLYTDGVVECVNTSHEEYSDRRLREFLRRNRELSSHDFVGALMADLDRHRGTAEIRDDTTIVTFKVI